jgi:indolepyruvate ferredoxin oxidoreductase
VQEYIDLGLHGWAMSRFSGCMVGFKALADTVESSASIAADPLGLQTLLPEDFVMPEGGLNCRSSTDTLGLQARKQEALMQDYKIYAALAYARKNQLNRITWDSPQARLGIVASGKSYLDVLEALQELGISEREAAAIGLRLFKVSMPWPLEPDGIREFATGLEEILVVEEKRQIVEYQLKEQLYNWRDDVRPRIVGKFDEKGEWVASRGEWLLSSKADFSVAQIARVIAARIARFHRSDAIDARLLMLQRKEQVLHKAVDTPARPAYYCAGCPHNSSTRVPDGSLALAGIGCHVMATAIFPEHNKLTTHMGGEGAPWIGQAHFSDRKHVFANLGDGTYFHSGYLAIRAAIAAGVNITYKILFNDAVAMTGGQPVDGTLTVAAVALQTQAEGARRVVVVTEDISRYQGTTQLPAGIELLDRQALDRVQRELREVAGTSILIYDQTCAAEKRRRRKKQKLIDPPKRLFINAAVCEGCGDCGAASNCTAILPLETPLGRKRQIDQSSCNKDYACVTGFCPSFVTVLGGTPRKSQALGAPGLETAASGLSAPSLPVLAQPWNIFVTGIGGTGVITIGALIGTAAHLEGKNVSVLDMTGMSQKNGSVTSHIRIASATTPLHAQRIATGEADLILGCDLLTAAGADAIAKTRTGRTRAIVNQHEQPIGNFAKEPDWQFPTVPAKSLLHEALDGAAEYVDAHRIASGLLGDAVMANMLMLGFAWQKGLVPVGEAALLRAIELNAVGVKANRTAFAVGRRLAVEPTWADARLATPVALPASTEPVDALIQRHADFLTQYQSPAYAGQYRQWVEHVRQAEATKMPAAKHLPLTRAAALGLFRLMAYKDEYEVARLYTQPQFLHQLESQFEGVKGLRLNLAPPLLARKDENGHPRKSEYGAWVLTAMRVLAQLRFLRGTRLDVFGYTAERRMERALVGEYRLEVAQYLATLSPATHNLAVSSARIAQTIRGFGHVKLKAVTSARAAWAAMKAV